MKTHDSLVRGLGWFSLGLGLAELFATDALAKFLATRRKAVLRAYGVRELATAAAILACRKPAAGLWSRVAGDALDLASLACLLRSSPPTNGNAACAFAAVAGVTAFDVWCAVAESRSASTPPHIQKSITVGRPAAELYQWWREPEKLARIMGHIATVVPAGERSTYWTLKAAGMHALSWHADYVDEREGKLLRWHTPPQEQVVSDGTVRFEPAPGDRGTEVTLNFRFCPPGRPPSALRLLGMAPEIATIRALRRFKSLAETGELPTLEKNPTARPGATANLV